MPPVKGNAHGPIRFDAIKKGTMKELFKFAKPYSFLLIVVLICIVAAAITSTITMTFMETIIDDHIKPMLLVGSTDFSGLLKVIVEMAVLFGVSVLTNLLQGIIMATVSQGMLRDIRNNLNTERLHHMTLYNRVRACLLL